jgi:hypothetical protein
MNNVRISIVIAALAFVSACSSAPRSPEAAGSGSTSIDARFDEARLRNSPYPYNANLP